MIHWHKGLKHLYKVDPIFKQYSSTNVLLKTSSDPFNVLFKSICGQQISTSAANSIYKASKVTFGNISPDNIFLNTDLVDFLPMTNNKKKSIKSLAEYFYINKLIKWNKISDSEVYDHLIKIFGIGPWTIEMFLIFYKGSQDIIPLKDLGLINSYKLFYKDNNLKNLNNLISLWSPYGTIITMNLWNSYDLNPVSY